MLTGGEASTQILSLCLYSVFKGRYVSIFGKKVITLHSTEVSPKGDHKCDGGQ